MVEEDYDIAFHMQFQIGLAIAVDVLEREGNRHLIVSRTIERRSNIDLNSRRISSCQFDHLNVSMEVQGNEVTWMSRTISMADHGIGLVRARMAVGEIVLALLPPRGETSERSTESYGAHH